MTVAAQTPINTYAFAGTYTFVYSFQVLQAADLAVTVDGVVKTLNVDYTIAGLGVQAGGTIAYLGVLTTGQVVVLRRVTVRSRSIDYQNNGDLLSATVNADFDRLWQAVQETDTLSVTRALLVPIGETAATLPPASVRANYLLGFNSAGDPIAVIPGPAGTATTVVIDLANLSQASKGAGQIGFGYALAYAAGTVGARLRETISIFDFMTTAQIADVQARTLTLDVTAAVQAAIDRANTLVGACVVAPAGSYRCTGSINLRKRVMLAGAGRVATIFSFSNAGDGFKSTWPINASTAVWIGLRDLAAINTNAANTGAGFADVGGTFVDLCNVYLQGWKFGVIFDQTELGTVDQCELIHGNGQTGIWLVNGADHTASAQKNYTNRITISRNQFNGAGGGLENILDDGGVNHSIRDNNFNDGLACLRVAAVAGLTFAGNESESHQGDPIILTTTTKAGAYVGPVSALDISGGNTFSDLTGNHIRIDEVQGGQIKANAHSGMVSQAYLFANGGTNPTTGLVIEGNSKLVINPGRTAAPFIDTISLVPVHNNALRQCGMTYVLAAIAAGTRTVTPASMEGIHYGTRLSCRNVDGTGYETVIVSAVTSTTFTAVFTLAKTADWIAMGGSPLDQEEGTWLPYLAGGTTAGAHTYNVQAGKWTRRGNIVRLTGNLSISAKDATMAGALQINGNPFPSSNFGDQIGTCQVVAFSGFTMPAGYSVIGGSVAAGAAPATLLRSGSGVAFTQLLATDIPGATCALVFRIDLETGGA